MTLVPASTTQAHHSFALLSQIPEQDYDEEQICMISHQSHKELNEGGKIIHLNCNGVNKYLNSTSLLRWIQAAESLRCIQCGALIDESRLEPLEGEMLLQHLPNLEEDLFELVAEGRRHAEMSISYPDDLDQIQDYILPILALKYQILVAKHELEAIEPYKLKTLHQESARDHECISYKHLTDIIDGEVNRLLPQIEERGKVQALTKLKAVVKDQHSYDARLVRTIDRVKEYEHFPLEMTRRSHQVAVLFFTVALLISGYVLGERLKPSPSFSANNPLMTSIILFYVCSGQLAAMGVSALAFFVQYAEFSSEKPLEEFYSEMEPQLPLF